MTTISTRRKYSRPQSSIGYSMQVRLEKQAESLPHRKERMHKIMSYRLPKVQSQDPEIIYSWLNSFDLGLKSISIGKSYEYPQSKFTRSRAITSSLGYRTMVYMHKETSRFSQHKEQLMGRTIVLQKRESKRRGDRECKDSIELGMESRSGVVSRGL